MSTKCPKCQFENPADTRFCGQCGAQLSPAEEISVSHTKTLQTPIKELTRGTTFANRYEFIEELGTGGMGRVYKVFDKKIKEEMALKLLKIEIAAEKNTIERFSNELKIARKIVHKNIGRMYDLNEDEGTHYITMEYVPGEDLKSFIRRAGQLSVGKSIFIAKQICEGLDEAHKMGVIHRDLKPSNIMVDKEGNARIMDFGIARSLKAKGVTGVGVMIGTPEYMSPEQAEGKEADKRSDVYSLGIILYEMLTGRVPFEGETPLSLAIKHKNEIPPSPKEFNEQIPEELSHIILKCMEKEKEKRFQGARELLSELSRIEKSFPFTDRVIPRRKPFTSKETTATLSLKKLFIPALIVVAVLILALIILQFIPGIGVISQASGKHSIAVLPFENLSPEKNREYLCEGIPDTLINALTNIKDLRVAAQKSTFSFKGKEQDVREIGRKLNVDSVLDGSMQIAGNRLRITVRLTNVQDGFQLWSEQYNREMDDVFAIQDDISLAIIDKLRIKLVVEEKTLLIKRYTENLEAYNLYLRGRHFWNKTTLEGSKKGIECFQQAIKKDPDYILPYAGIADCYIVLGLFYIPPKEAFPMAKAAASKALEMDKTHAAAHASLGLVKLLYDWDWPAAERELIRAIELDPSYANAHLWYSIYLTIMGKHDDAIVEAKRAKELDPISPLTTWFLGSVLFYARQYDQVIKECRNSLEIDPGNLLPHLLISMAYIKKKAFNEAGLQMKKALELSESSDQLPTLRLIISYILKGKIDELSKVIDDLDKGLRKDYFSPYNIATIYVSMGQKEQAFKWLERAYEEHDLWMIVLKVDPKFDNLRSDPRFTALVKKIGLE